MEAGAGPAYIAGRPNLQDILMEVLDAHMDAPEIMVHVAGEQVTGPVHGKNKHRLHDAIEFYTRCLAWLLCAWRCYVLLA